MRCQRKLLFVFLLVSGVATGQTQTFTRDGVEFALELPSQQWRAVSRLDVHDHVEFIYEGDAANGYLRLRKNMVDAGTLPEVLFQRDERQTLHSLPGYVVCGECIGEKFAGRLSGMTFNYEYSSGGQPMAGRLYYLQVDNRTIYTLHFTGARDKLQALRDQIDSMARTFRMK